MKYMQNITVINYTSIYNLKNKKRNTSYSLKREFSIDAMKGIKIVKNKK